MNTPASERENSANLKDSSHLIRFGKHQLHQWAVYLSLGIIAAILLFTITTLDTSFQPAPKSPGAAVQPLKQPIVKVENHRETDSLINNLKQHGLWSINPAQEVPRFFIESYPHDLHTVEDITIKKRVFLHSLLPHALFVRQEALQKRDRLKLILSKIECSLEDINFDIGLEYENQCSWSDFLAQDEVSFIQKLCRNYRTTSAAGLLQRVDAVPTSIILAQGALESSWGSSRFAREGNSLFGMWTWKTQGIVPSKRDEGKTHKVKTYKNILDSVRAYHLTLNRLDPYDQFRQLRTNTDDPLILVEGLSMYSARGEEYVEEIKNIILANELQKYDSYRLSDPNQAKIINPSTKSTSIAESDKVSL
jgi:Bax protein